VRVLIAGGGTAGHVFPALAVARALRERGHTVRFAGTAQGPEARLVPADGFDFVEVEASPFVRKASLRVAVAPAVTVRSVGRCRPLVEGADVVLGMGGYVSLPVAIAALRGRRPLVLHEQNAVPGLANRSLARAARAVAVSFAEAVRGLARSARTVVTGNPVREEVLAVRTDRERLAKEAVEELDLDPDRRTVLVFGGSQGALHLDHAFVDAIPRIGLEDVQYVLLAGDAHAAAIQGAVGDAPRVRVLAFLARMELAYAVADLAITRAGATTIAEVAACGVPAVLVPYPYATGRHQEANARALRRAGGATVLLDDELDGSVLAERIEALLGDPSALAAMASRALTWSRPDAANAVADLVLEAGSAA
jgi:UDP-N-acetylglucosamine--N-acetylmuramyl-(pentapeptide) pyrophosphoryl-undecaprenol N-acetylglucosamine transferase